MINKTTQKKLKKIIGKEYAQGVLDILKINGKVNRLGEPHNEQYIRTVFSGSRNNEDVEDAIFEYAQQQLKLAAKRKATRESILN